MTPAQMEQEKVESAIKTDLILSGEIMAITLSSVAATTPSFWGQALILAAVGIGITVAVYGVVAIIVKMDDLGASLARNPLPASSLLGLRKRGAVEASPRTADRVLLPVSRAVGRGLVQGMPPFLKMLSVVGTAAMLWVGGGILIHGLEETGLPQIAHWLHDLAAAAGHAVPEWGVGAVEWLISASGAGVLGLVVGAALIPTSTHLLAPVLRAIQSKIRGKVRTENTPAPV